MTDSTLKSAQKLLVNGVAPREVARNLGVSVPTLYRWVPAASLPVSITASLNALWCPFSGATSFRLLAALPSGLAYSVVRCVTRPQCTQNKVIHRSPPCKVRDGLYREHTINKQSLLKSLSKEKVQGICPKARLPIPLLPLVELELSPAAICWLMAQAKRYSKRLEDVMISAWRYISHLKGKAAIAYILTLLKKNQDFRNIRSALEEKYLQHVQTKAAQARISALDERFHNFMAVSKDGRKIGIFDSEAKTIICNGHRLLPVNTRFGHLLVEGEVRLVPPDDFWNTYSE